MFLFCNYLHYPFCEMFMPKISDKQYDAVISFLAPHYFADEKVKAKKKIAWIHTDYSTIDIDVNAEIEMWNKYDKIVSISDKCTQAFLDKMPVLQDKIIRIDNIITKEMILSQANGHRFYMFLNAETGNVCVVYVRNDGGYGLLEPEID